MTETNRSTLGPSNMVTLHTDKPSGETSAVDAVADGAFSDPAASPTQNTRGVNEKTLTAPVERRISEIRSMLAEETNQLDPLTRQPGKRMSDPTRRANLERELRHLEERELPYVRTRAAQIAADRAALPSREETMRTQLEHRARIQARAAELADEQEAEVLARRLVAGKQNH